MSLSDALGSLGVALLLVAFLLNLRKVISTDNKWYTILNIVGAALCGYSSYLIKFYPFVILETVWVLAAFSSLVKRVPRETLDE
jgi:cytochrome bd-type quinol oxidase subunit 2